MCYRRLLTLAVDSPPAGGVAQCAYGIYGELETFFFNPMTGAVAYQTAQLSQLGSPFGIVADGPIVFTGQWGNRVQAASVAANGTMRFVPGSPAADPSQPSAAGTSVAWFDGTHGNFVVAEACAGGTLAFANYRPGPCVAAAASAASPRPFTPVPSCCPYATTYA